MPHIRAYAFGYLPYHKHLGIRSAACVAWRLYSRPHLALHLLLPGAVTLALSRAAYTNAAPLYQCLGERATGAALTLPPRLRALSPAIISVNAAKKKIWHEKRREISGGEGIGGGLK